MAQWEGLAVANCRDRNKREIERIENGLVFNENKTHRSEN
jgi:hypothetical protein